MTLADDLNSALRYAPELGTAPSLAVTAASDTQDPIGTAQALAHSGNLSAQSQAADAIARKVGSPNLFHRTLGWLGGSLSTVGHAVQSIPGVQPAERQVLQTLNYAGAPLREVQHDYRYLHDVEARHGPMAALLEALPIAVGAGTGAYFGGSAQSGALAGEAVAALEGRVLYRDSFARTAAGADYQGHYDRDTGQYFGPKGMVSIGRDITGHGGAQSGFIDGLSDLLLDPVALAGGYAAHVRSPEGVGGAVGTRFSSAPHGQTLAIRESDLTSRVANLGRVNRAFEDIARLQSPTEIAMAYPKFQGLQVPLAAARTADEVTDVFRGALTKLEMGTMEMPTMSWTRLPFSTVGRAVRSYDGTGSGLIRSVTSLLPTEYDPETRALSNKTFSLGSPNATRGVYNVMRFSQSHDVARDLADQFAGAMDDPGKQILIYKNGIKAMLIAKGLPEDSKFVINTVDELSQRAMGGGDGVAYGADMAGRDLSKVATDKGSSSLGVLMSQQGKLAFPDFNAITREARSLNVAKNFYGSADDWMYNKFTQGVFKPLVLLSGGFAARLSAAEAIPAALREGVNNIVGSRLAASAAKEMSGEELGHLSATVAHVLGGVDKLLADPERTAFAVNLIHDNGGHLVAPAIDTATPSAEIGNPAERASRSLYAAYRKIPGRNRLGNEFGLFGPHDVEHNADTWMRWLSQVSNDPASQAAADGYMTAMRAGQTMDDATTAGANAAKRWLDAQPPATINTMGRHFAVPPGAEGVDPHEGWARTIMENVKGATHTPHIMTEGGEILREGSPHMELLRNVSEGTQTKLNTLEAIPQEDRPLMMPGRKLMPDPTSTVQRIANVGFKKVIDPVINFVSREPLYVNEAWKQYKYLKPLVDSGDMLAEDARSIAQTRAVNNVLPFIHNTLERSQFSTLARNFMPFYFAQEQAYKRFGRLLADDPGAFRRFQLMITGLHEVGSTQTDPNGQSFLAYPGAGFLSKAATKAASSIGIPTMGSVPISFSGQLRSLNTVFPFAEGARPSFGPVVAIPSHVITNLLPELTPLTTEVLGAPATSGSVWDQLIPNQTLKGVVQAMDPGMRTRSMQNSVAYSIQNLAHQQQTAMDKWTAAGNDPASPNAPHLVPTTTDSHEWQKFIERIRNQARINFLVKTAVGSVTPAAPVVNTGDWHLRAELSAASKKVGLAQAISDFLVKHPDATADTVFLSKSTTGTTLPATTVAQQWINDNNGFLSAYPEAAAWFIPQDPGAFNQTVYNQQLAQHLRVHKSPEQVMDDIHIAAGNAQFYNHDLPDYKNQLAQAKASGDGHLVSQIQAGFSNYVSKVLGPQNPVWWDDLSSADRDHKRQIAVQQMQTMFDAGQAPDSPQTADLRSLLSDFADYRNQKQAATNNPNVTQAQIKSGWQNYLTQLAAQKPNMAPVIRSVFMQL